MTKEDYKEVALMAMEMEMEKERLKEIVSYNGEEYRSAMKEEEVVKDEKDSGV